MGAGCLICCLLELEGFVLIAASEKLWHELVEETVSPVLQTPDMVTGKRDLLIYSSSFVRDCRCAVIVDRVFV
jgi:hypothetical protein